MKRSLFLAMAALASAAFVLQTGDAGGDKNSPWKPAIPEEAYAALSARSVKAIETLAASGPKDAAEKIEVEAAILFGFTMSTKKAGSDDAGKTRAAAILAVQAARNGQLKKLTGFGKSIAAAPNTPAGITPRKAYLQELAWVMENFKNKTKGGEGIHTELQYQVKLKNLNGIEALIGSLSSKKLSDANLAKVEKELPLLGYRIAVIGSLTHEFAPKKGAGQWREISLQMRDASLALAEAARAKNADGIQKAATSLENTCTKCHSEFKKN